jgi:hypothetical protein
MGYHGVYQKTRIDELYKRIPGLALFRASIRTPLGGLCDFRTLRLAPTLPLWETKGIFFRQKKFIKMLHVLRKKSTRYVP